MTITVPPLTSTVMASVVKLTPALLPASTMPLRGVPACLPSRRSRAAVRELFNHLAGTHPRTPTKH